MSFCLPFPPDSEGFIPPIEVPYVAVYPYDISLPHLFENFAREHHFLDYDKSPEDLAALMQSWLFFGLISEVCGIDIDHNLFVRTRTQAGRNFRFIDSRLDNVLHQLVTQRFAFLAKQSGQQADVAWSAIANTIRSAEGKASTFERMHSHRESSLPSIALLIQLLLDWLKVSYNDHRIARRQNHVLHCKPSGLDENPLPLSAGLLVQRLYDHGWCPRRVLNTCTSLSRTTLYYLSFLKRTAATQHAHKSCTVADCFMAVQAPNASHRSAGCACSQIRPDWKKVKRLLKSGKIPLMQVTKEPSGQLDLRILEAASYTRYTAISHIWSDNQLGSSGNSLPACQLEQLVTNLKTVNKGFGPGFWIFDKLCSWLSCVLWRLGIFEHPRGGTNLFWLDTLCIPNEELEDSEVDRIEAANLRIDAINKMDLVYSMATEVLALDNELQGLDGGAQPTPTIGEGFLTACYNIFTGPSDDRYTQTLAYAFSSNWHGRAWTLQEGVLARRCLLQFQGCVLEARGLVSHAVRTAEMRSWTGTVSLQAFARASRTPHQQSLINSSSTKENKFTIAIRFVVDVALTLYVLSTLPFWYLSLYPNNDVTTWAKSLESGDSPPEPGCMSELIQHDLSGYIRGCLQAPMNEDSAQRFRDVWNALAGRSTTKREDLHVVLANLLGFNAGFMMRKASQPHDRMRAILGNLDELPLDLLFLNVDKVDANSSRPGDHTLDLWMPLYPGDGLLNSKALMIRHGHGLFLSTQAHSELRVIRIDFLRESARRFELSSYVEVPGTNPSESDQEKLWVSDYDRRDGQTGLHSDVYHETYILFHDTLGQTCAGARMTVNRVVDKSIYLRYDCAVQISRRNDGSWLPQFPCLRARRQPADSLLVLDQLRRSQEQVAPGQAQVSTDTAALRLPRRPPNYTIEHNNGIENIAMFVGGICWCATLELALLFGIFVIKPCTDEKLRRVGTAIFAVLSYWSSVHWFLIPRAIVEYLLRWVYLKQWAASFDKEWEPEQVLRSPRVRDLVGLPRTVEKLAVKLFCLSIIWPLFIVWLVPSYCVMMPFTLVSRLLKHDGQTMPWQYWPSLPGPMDQTLQNLLHLWPDSSSN